MNHIALKYRITFLLFAIMVVGAFSVVSGQEKRSVTLIPVGLDAFRMWDKWPMQRIGVRTYMRSTYDREGGNESADAGHFLFANEEDQNVTLDVKGKGILYFFRANHWHGSPWHFWVDGTDHLVKETGTSDPNDAKEKFKAAEFIPSEVFPRPLNWTWGATKGADLIWTPVPFMQSFRIAYSRTHYGTGYYIYSLYANENQLSRPLNTWVLKESPDKDVLELIGRSGTDIAPKNIFSESRKLRLSDKRIEIASIGSIPSVIRAFKMTIPIDKAVDMERVRLQITWDGARYPSIDAPLCLFFGAGTFYNRDKREYLVKGFPINIRFDYPANKLEMACYYPMPFFSSAKFELNGVDPDTTEISYEIRYEDLTTPIDLSSYFHATYRDIPDPELGKDMVFLDTQGIEGETDWSGSFVGTSFIFSHNGLLATLEGDPRFFFDNSRTPQAYGTGTEEWAGGGDYWGGENMTLPFVGHPCGAAGKSNAKNEKDQIESAYRFLLSDLMPFGRRAVICFEHGAENLSTEHYEAVTYWYGLPKPSLVKSDSVDVGNYLSEKEHLYYSPQASSIDSIISRFELGIDLFPYSPWNLSVDGIPNYADLMGKEVYPAQKEYGRTTVGVSEFDVKISPRNIGVLIRRTLDYSFPNQTAEVYIANGNLRKPKNGDWEKAGIWYLAGSNTCLYSDPEGELENRLCRTETSNRRLRDDEFLVPARLTEGKDSIRIRLKFVPNEQSLFPNFPFPKHSVWSELRYDVFSYITPEFTIMKTKR